MIESRQQEIDHSPDSPPLFATYEFSGFLDDVYATLVVRLHHTPGFQKRKLWKDYAGCERLTCRDASGNDLDSPACPALECMGMQQRCSISIQVRFRMPV